MTTKTLYFSLNPSEEGFITRFLGKKEKFDSSDIKNLRIILSKERGRILYFLKNQKPKSIYHLAKLLKRDFKSVYSDLKILEKFGIIEFILERKGNKEKMVPTIAHNRIEMILNI